MTCHCQKRLLPRCYPRANRQKQGVPQVNINKILSSPIKWSIQIDIETPQYHCDNCQRDITHDVRVRCLTCTNFDLCVECWYSGVEIPPHTRNHECEVIETLDCCVFTEDWSAQEELTLLDAISSAGIGNWKEVAKQIESKTEEECKQHYLKVYFSSQHAPLPVKKSFIIRCSLHFTLLSLQGSKQSC